ncbi:PQQ-binding-like beta-propeller repeat protein [Aestuariimicrobium soli]|uniref:outer membrane protein assembly factor BamB family protein n=1 Tax=Aestuariimicrobium soli TaxID=2035834 RepID=UPI003EC03179
MSESPITQAPHAFTRRGVLAGGAGVAATLATATTLATAPATPAHAAPPAPDDVVLATIGVVTDTHLNAEVDRAPIMRRVYQWMADRTPDAVLHCGDITDYGADDEFAAYRATIPTALEGRIHHVPGNHEWRWDPTVLETYERLFGPRNSMFEVAGVRFVGLSPFQVLEEPGVYDDDLLGWFDRTCSKGRTMPTVCFQHMPIGAGRYFINNSEEFVALAQRHDVRALFAGHTHAQRLDDTNGFVQVTGNAERNSWAYWTRIVRRGSQLLQTVDSLAFGAADEPVVARVVEIPLTGDRPALALEPSGVTTRPTDDGRAVVVTVQAPAAESVVGNVLPQRIFGGTLEPASMAFTRVRQGLFAATVPVDTPAAGQHRVELTLTNRAAQYHHRSAFTTPAGEVRVTGSHRLGGQVQPAIMDAGDGSVLAASTNGRLAQLRVDGRGGLRPQWQTSVAPMSRAGEVVDGVAYLPTIDHQVVAVRVADGRQLWRTDLGAPSLSRVVATTVQGDPALFATAGRTTVRLDPRTGSVVWRAEQGQLFAGRLGVDDQRVYVGSGTGHAVAFDVATGEQQWAVEISGRADRYGRMLYSPWDCTVQFPTDDTVFLATVGAGFALDRATGAQVWRLAGNRTYAPGLMIEQGLLLAQENHLVDLVDPATGTVRWSASLAPWRFFGSGLVHAPASGTGPDEAFLVSAMGRLGRIDLSTGTAEQLLQVSTANTFSTPVLVGEGSSRHLVTGWQDGVVRAVRV